MTVAVHVGGVEEVQPELERAVHDAERILTIGLEAAVLGRHAEVHRAEHEGAHPQAGTSEESIVHGACLLHGRGRCRNVIDDVVAPEPCVPLRYSL